MQVYSTLPCLSPSGLLFLESRDQCSRFAHLRVCTISSSLLYTSLSDTNGSIVKDPARNHLTRPPPFNFRIRPQVGTSNKQEIEVATPTANGLQTDTSANSFGPAPAFTRNAGSFTRPKRGPNAAGQRAEEY